MQTLPGLAHHGCQPPMEAAGPCLPYRKAPGTLHYHTMFSDWEIVPWAHCTEPASPQNWCSFIRLPKLSCPGPLDRTIMPPLPLQSVSVVALTHPTGLMVATASEQHSRYSRRCYWRDKDCFSGGHRMKIVE